MIEPLSGFTASCVSIPRGDSPDTVNSIRTAHLWKIEDHITAHADRIAALETALCLCIICAGNPYPAEGCRQVIRTAQDTLEGKEGGL